MALSQTDICNLALQRVGAPAIMDILDTEDKNARACLLAFEATVREVSRERRWNCLRKRATLGQLDEAPAFEWAKQYQLPTDFISLVEVNGFDYHGQPQAHWEIEGRRLLTDEERADITYVAYVDDPVEWDALFSNAVVVLLASKLAARLRSDDLNVSRGLLDEYMRVALPKAGMRGGAEHRRTRYNPAEGSEFIRSRHISTNG